MPKQNVPLLSFNRGEISKHALGRIDVEQLRLVAETQINFVPLTLGPMSLRPGTRYLGSTKGDGAANILPFVFGADDTALLEFTASALRVWVNNALLTVHAVDATITASDFSSSGTWSLSATSGASATISDGMLNLHAVARGSSAYAEQPVNVGSATNVVHRLRIVVIRGPVTFQIGSTSGAEDYFARTSLGTGTHSIAFTPTASPFYVRFSTTTATTKRIDSITVESAGTLELPTPYGASDLANLRIDQSGDIVYVACSGFQQRQVERRDNNSWSITLFEPVGGPFTDQPEWATQIGMNPDAASGGTRTITATANYFTNNHTNSLLKVECPRQNFRNDVAGSNWFTDTIRVTGATAADRTLGYQLTGTWVGTVTLQRSIDGADFGFIDVETRTANGTYTLNDSATFANVEVWYRVGFVAGSYTSGSVTVLLSAPGASDDRSGQARIIGINSATQAQIEMLSTFRDIDGSNIWNPADWSAEVGWPDVVRLHDGRLWWGGRDKVWGSVSDDFTSHDETFAGDAGPINRSIGSGPQANVRWMLSLARLLVGRDSGVESIRSSNFDSPITPTDFTSRTCSSKGCAALPALKVDTRGVYVDSSGRRVYELVYAAEAGDYRPRDLTHLNLDIGAAGLVDCAAQFQPDTRLHFVRADGEVAVLTYEWEEGVEAWWRIRMGGAFGGGAAVVESVCVLPGELEDAVYYVVKRTINGQTRRTIEKFARADECVGGVLNNQADAHIVYSGAATATITGLSHLEGETVVAWGAGKDLGAYTVAGGQITLAQAVTGAVVGLRYTAQFQSAKLAYAAALGTPLTQKKRIDKIGVVLVDTHHQGLEYGPDFVTMDNLPLVEEGSETAADTVWSEFDAPMIAFPGEWHTDSRLCLRATAPRPCTVVACVIGITTHERS